MRWRDVARVHLVTAPARESPSLPAPVLLGAVALLGAATACKHDDAGPGLPPRGFVMGFSAIPPSPDPALQLPTLSLSTQHSDAGLLQLSIPWTVLLTDTAAATEVRTVRLPLANYYRGNQKKIVVALDVTNGLNRAEEDPALVAAGRSITDTAVQRLYREYVSAVDSILHPDFLSLAAETNLIRLAAPAPVYAAVVKLANDAATGIRAAGSTTRLLVSVQVETAWGRLQQPPVPYQGIGQDLADFAFIDLLGLSSYPYLAGFADPADLPDDYYSRLTQNRGLPVIILEGGWPSRSVAGVTSTPELQAAYLARQAELLGAAQGAGWFQITFTDLATSAFPPATGAALLPFAFNGLVDSALQAKPALAAWDSVQARPLSSRR